MQARATLNACPVPWSSSRIWAPGEDTLRLRCLVLSRDKRFPDHSANRLVEPVAIQSISRGSRGRAASTARRPQTWPVCSRSILDRQAPERPSDRSAQASARAVQHTVCLRGRLRVVPLFAFDPGEAAHAPGRIQVPRLRRFLRHRDCSLIHDPGVVISALLHIGCSHQRESIRQPRLIDWLSILNERESASPALGESPSILFFEREGKIGERPE